MNPYLQHGKAEGGSVLNKEEMVLSLNQEMVVKRWKVKDEEFRNFFYGFKYALVFACVCLCMCV